MYSYGPLHMARRPARTYLQQLCEDTGCSPEDLPKAMNDREEWRERVRDIRADAARQDDDDDDIGCLNIHGIHVTANNPINNNVSFVSDLKIVYYNNY